LNQQIACLPMQAERKEGSAVPTTVSFTYADPIALPQPVESRAIS
jgi:hypothetical protein